MYSIPTFGLWRITLKPLKPTLITIRSSFYERMYCVTNPLFCMPIDAIYVNIPYCTASC